MAFAVQGRICEGELAGIPLPATLRPPTPLTDDELMAFSRRNRPFRIELNARGEIEIMTPVGGDGGNLESLINSEVAIWAREHGGLSFSSSTGFRLPDASVLSPDAAWVSSDRWKNLSKEARRSYPPLCPEFVIEIRSASDSRPVLEAKMETWLANGAQLAWMIDPFAATVSVYRPGAPVNVLDRPEVLQADGPVQGFRLPIRDLWNP